MFMTTQKCYTQHMHGIILHKFDFWADPVVHVPFGKEDLMRKCLMGEHLRLFWTNCSLG